MRYAVSRAYFTERFAIALSPRDRAALRRLSRATGEAQAVIVRRLVRQEAERRGLWPPQHDDGERETDNHVEVSS